MHGDAVTVGPDDTLERAATLMHDHDVSRLPVVEADGRLVGIVARVDILRDLIEPSGHRGLTDCVTSSARPGSDVDLRRIAHNVGVLKRHRRAGAAVRRGQGRRVRPRRGGGEPRRARPPAPTRWRSRWSRRARAAQAPASTHRCSCCRKPRPRRSTLLVANRLEPTVYTAAAVTQLAAPRAEPAQPARPLPVHLKVDTGMHRVGAAPADAVGAGAGHRRARRASRWPRCGPTSPWPTSPTTRTPPSSWPASRGRGRARPPPGCVRRCCHAANSAAALGPPGGPLRPRAMRHRRLRHRAVARALSGSARPPARAVADGAGLVREDASPPGSACRTGCGTAATGQRDRHRADRLRRRGAPPAVGRGGEVLIGGRRRPIAGTVTMDQILVDCGDDDRSRSGDEVVLHRRPGRRADHRRGLGRVSTRSATRSCAASGPRVPRRYRPDPSDRRSCRSSSLEEP